MNFPTMVYRCPGMHQRPGGTFSIQGVRSQAELDDAIKDGWSTTLPEAMSKHDDAPVTLQSVKDEIEVLGDSEPPTRAELEQQATELGIKFKKSTTDEELAKKIDEALEG